MVLGSTSMWEGGNIYGVFSLCMERTSMSHMCSLLLGKIPFNPLFCPCVLTHMMVVGPSLYEREKTCMVYFFHVWSPPECHACALYYWERLPSIHYFVLMCFTHMTIMGSTFIWERGNMHSVFSPYMEPIQCHVLFTIGKDSLQSIVLYLYVLLTLHMHVTTFFKLSFKDLNSDLNFLHSISTYIYGVIIAPKVCGGACDFFIITEKIFFFFGWESTKKSRS